MVLTPVVDPDWQDRSSRVTSIPGHGWLVAYEASGWREYLERAWCRVEMMMAAAYPVADAEQRSGLFRAHLQAALREGRRPHAIFGDRELSNGNAPPKFLLPRTRKVFEMYRPIDRSVTDDRDIEILEHLSSNVYQMWPVVGGKRWVSWLSQGGIRRGGLYIEGYTIWADKGPGEERFRMKKVLPRMRGSL